MCVNVGSASSNEMLIWGFSPFFSSVHTPFGPLCWHKIKRLGYFENIRAIETNLKKTNLKSGIPDDVLIPAPVCKTTCLACLIQLANIAIFSVTLSKLSNFYQINNWDGYWRLLIKLQMHKLLQEFQVFLYLRKVINHQHNYKTLLE